MKTVHREKSKQLFLNLEKLGVHGVHLTLWLGQSLSLSLSRSVSPLYTHIHKPTHTRSILLKPSKTLINFLNLGKIFR